MQTSTGQLKFGARSGSKGTLGERRWTCEVGPMSPESKITMVDRFHLADVNVCLVTGLDRGSAEIIVTLDARVHHGKKTDPPKP